MPLMFGGTGEAAARLEPYARILAPAADRGLAALRPGPVRTLRQDDPQRHRIRNDAGVRRGLRADERPPDLELDVAAIAELWRHGSVVRSWLLDLTAEFLREDSELAGIAPVVADSRRGTVDRAGGIEQGVRRR